jgi:hypothetical protein
MPPAIQRAKMQTLDVADGSFASVWRSARYFRSTPMNGLRETGPAGPFCANSGRYWYGAFRIIAIRDELSAASTKKLLVKKRARGHHEGRSSPLQAAST